MLLPLSSSLDFWDHISGVPLTALSSRLPPLPAAALAPSSPVILFVHSTSVDALCATRVATHLFRSDLIRYEIHPVHTYAALQAAYNQVCAVHRNGAIRAVVLLNFGATVDVNALLRLSQKEDGEGERTGEEGAQVPFFVLDSHRPVHLRNIAAETVVVVLDSEEITGVTPIDFGVEDEWGVVLSESEEEDAPEDGKHDDDEEDGFLDGGDDVDENGNLQGFIDEGAKEEEDDDEQDQTQQDITARDSGDKALPSTDAAAESSCLHLDADAINLSPAPPLSQHQHPPSSEPQRKRRRLGASTSAGRSSSAASVESSRARRRRVIAQRPQALSEERANVRQYYHATHEAASSALVMQYIADKKRLSTPNVLWYAILGVTSQYMQASVTDDGAHAGYMAAIAALRGLVDAGCAAAGEEEASHAGTTYGSASIDGKIRRSSELRLLFLRDWNVHDALQYSMSTATCLGTWRRSGRQRALELLATLGIRLTHAKQPFWALPQHDKAALDARLHAVLKRFRLPERVEYEGFTKGGRCAADWVDATNALLSARGNCENEIERFWMAYDALSERGDLGVGTQLGIENAKRVHQVGGEVVELRRYKSGGRFRYAFVEDEDVVILQGIARFVRHALKRGGVVDKGMIVVGGGGKIVEDGVGGGVKEAVRMVHGQQAVGWFRIAQGADIEFLAVLTEVLR